MDEQLDQLHREISLLKNEIEEIRGLLQGRGDVIKSMQEMMRNQQQTIDGLLDQLAKSKI